MSAPRGALLLGTVTTVANSVNQCQNISMKSRQNGGYCSRKPSFLADISKDFRAIAWSVIELQNFEHPPDAPFFKTGLVTSGDYHDAFSCVGGRV